MRAQIKWTLALLILWRKGHIMLCLELAMKKKIV
ncbi:unnamed protein product, partial [Vitis vinifera]